MSFTVVIRSADREAGGDADDCYIKINGMDTKYNKYLVEVQNFMISSFTGLTTNFLELRSDNMPIINGIDSKFHRLRTVAFMNFNTFYQSPFIFEITPFNGIIHFQLYTDDGILTTINEDWVLSLKLTGIM